uniref:ARID domain-containing protein n=1 Tax=Rhodosorus marinus TaxID=101924 RepID=A0A7S3ELY9_9RHOD|mmetsp:Transcript_51/g.114  ORF Transcript_51/g.114 Transcript_51/m.114 type:complete len:360 (+) Transcript_51:387-1466(+)
MDAFGPDLLSTEPGETVQESEKDLRVDNEGMEDAIQKYKAVVPEIGRRFISEQMKNGSMGSGSPKDDFLADHKHFMTEIGELNFKVPTLGGSPLNIYQLFVEVMDQGGLNNVIETRAFKIVTRKLVLPRSCTSAAYMLRQSYEKILYQYEQHFVFGRDAQRTKLLLMEKKKLIEAENQLKQEASRANEQQVDPGLGAQPSASEAAKEPSVTSGRERPKRKAAETAVTAVAASVSIDTFGVNPSPNMPRRRGRPPSAEKLAARAAAAAAQAAASGAVPNGGYAHGGAEGRNLYCANIEPPPQAVFNYDNPQDREKLVLSIAGDVREQVAWGLGAANALSCDNRRNLLVRDFPGLVDGKYH